MKIRVKVRPNSEEQNIVLVEGVYIITLKSPPVDNKANLELIKLLTKYFKKEARIKSGFNSREKIVEISDD